MDSQGKHLVLGGHGFIGQHLVHQLLSQGAAVRIFDRSPEPQFELHTYTDQDDLEIMVGDFQDRAAVSAALDGVSTVYHLISTTVPSTSISRPIFDIETNLISSLQLLDLCKEQGVDQIVFASSGGTVYGVLTDVPALETHPTHPISPHGITKLTCEKYIHYYHHMAGLRYKIMRIANPYGTGQYPKRPQGVVNTILWKVYEQQPIEVWGDGHVVRDYLFVDDVARALVQAAAHPAQAAIFNVGSMVGTSLREVIDLVFDVTGQQVAVNYMPQRAFDVPVSILDTTHIQSELGWTPHYALRDGIHQTWEWMQSVSENAPSE